MSKVSNLKNLSQTHSVWIAENPLRLWRLSRSNKIAQAMVGNCINRSTQAIRDYESGGYKPDDTAMDSLASLIGITGNTLRRKWDKWLMTKPSF